MGKQRVVRLPGQVPVANRSAPIKVCVYPATGEGWLVRVLAGLSVDSAEYFGVKVNSRKGTFQIGQIALAWDKPGLRPCGTLLELWLVAAEGLPARSGPLCLTTTNPPRTYARGGFGSG